MIIKDDHGCSQQLLTGYNSRNQR